MLCQWLGPLGFNSAVILLPAHPASLHIILSLGCSFYFSESQDAIVLQTCH